MWKLIALAVDMKEVVGFWDEMMGCLWKEQKVQISTSKCSSSLLFQIYWDSASRIVTLQFTHHWTWTPLTASRIRNCYLQLSSGGKLGNHIWQSRMKRKIPKDDKSRTILGIHISNNLSSKCQKTLYFCGAYPPKDMGGLLETRSYRRIL